MRWFDNVGIAGILIVGVGAVISTIGCGLLAIALAGDVLVEFADRGDG